MTSGIYLLKFNYLGHEYNYVGKSVDIMRRFGEHAESFIKGKAAKKLQAMYDVAGDPEFYILQRCHADHIDVVEAYYIDFFKGHYSLNTVGMSNPFYHVKPDEHEKYLDKSLDTLIFDLIVEENRATRAEETIETLSEEILELERKRSEEELQADIEHRVHQLQTELDNKKLYIEQILGRVEQFEKLPWYKRMFTKPL